MDYRLLGPLEASDGGTPVVFGGRKQRALLARLLLDANRTVAVDRLIDDLWGADVPDTAAKMVQIYVSQLRKALPAAAPLRTRAPGYVIEVERDGLDLERFHRLREEGRAALDTGDAATASDRLSDALALWRGPALAEFSEPFARTERAHLEELHLVCVEDRIDADLALGRHADLVGELEALIARYALRERLHGQLMLALYRSGRQADALDAYESVRRTMDEQLGIEPSHALKALHRQILMQDRNLDPRSPESPARQGGPLEQRIGFCTSVDGVKIAYARHGTGPTIVKTANWLTHLEHDWNSPIWRHWLEGLADGHTVIRYDERCCGLSDWDAERLDIEAWVSDLEAVVDAAGLERFALVGLSQGPPIAIAYAVRHPERVSHLVFCGGYARGRNKRPVSEPQRREDDVLLSLMKVGWGRDDRTFRQVFTSMFIPGATSEQMDWFDELQRISTSPENAERLEHAWYQVDVTDLLAQVTTPTLVAHARADRVVPFAEGRLLAAGIAGARFLPLDSGNHILLPDEPAWPTFLSELHAFLGSDAPQAGG